MLPSPNSVSQILFVAAKDSNSRDSIPTTLLARFPCAMIRQEDDEKNPRFFCFAWTAEPARRRLLVTDCCSGRRARADNGARHGSACINRVTDSVRHGAANSGQGSISCEPADGRDVSGRAERSGDRLSAVAPNRPKRSIKQDLSSLQHSRCPRDQAGDQPLGRPEPLAVGYCHGATGPARWHTGRRQPNGPDRAPVRDEHRIQIGAPSIGKQFLANHGYHAPSARSHSVSRQIGVWTERKRKRQT